MLNYCLFRILVVFIFWNSLIVKVNAKDAVFTGRVSKLIPEQHLMRLRLEFVNAKFLKRGDDLEFWNEGRSDLRCQAVIQGRSNEYVLAEVKNWNKCIRKVGTTTGSFLFFESKELLKTLSAARELMAVLLKKRAILAGYKDRNNSANYENNLRMDNINAIYQERMERLKSEWQEALKGVTDLKNNNDRDMLSIDNQIKALDFEIERYRVEDENVIKDHWSLNPSEFVIK
jgi:hypothetical protein